MRDHAAGREPTVVGEEIDPRDVRLAERRDERSHDPDRVGEGTFQADLVDERGAELDVRRRKVA